jgi:hypothetical protein
MEQLKKSNLPIAKKREIKQRLIKLRKKLVLDEKKRREIIEKISELEFLTPGQLENLFNSNYYESVIKDILEERVAEEKCEFLMCSERNRNGTLKAKFKISRNRLFENDSRKSYCSEKCYNYWVCMSERFEELYVEKLDGKIDRIRLIDFGIIDVSKEFELDELVSVEPIRLEDVENVNDDKHADSDDEINASKNSKNVKKFNDTVKSESRTKIVPQKPETTQLELELSLEKLYKSWLEPLDAVEFNPKIEEEKSGKPAPHLPNNDKYEKTNIRRKTLTDQLVKIVRVTCCTLFKIQYENGIPIDYEPLVRRLVGQFRLNNGNVMIVKREMKVFVGLVVGVLLHLMRTFEKEGRDGEKHGENSDEAILDKKINGNLYLDVSLMNSQQITFISCLYKKLGTLVVDKYRVEEDERVLTEIKIMSHSHRQKEAESGGMDLEKFQALLLEDENEVRSDSSDDDFDDEANAGWQTKVMSGSFFAS